MPQRDISRQARCQAVSARASLRRAGMSRTAERIEHKGGGGGKVFTRGRRTGRVTEEKSPRWIDQRGQGGYAAVDSRSFASRASAVL